MVFDSLKGLEDKNNKILEMEKNLKETEEKYKMKITDFETEIKETQDVIDKYANIKKFLKITSTDVDLLFEYLKQHKEIAYAGGKIYLEDLKDKNFHEALEYLKEIVLSKNKCKPKA